MKIGVINADLRQVAIYDTLISNGFDAVLVNHMSDLKDVFTALVLPLKGCSDGFQVNLMSGILALDEYIKEHPSIQIFSGLENPWLNQLSHNVCYLMGKREVIMQNAELTAQGVLAEVLKHLDRNIKKLDIDVIGHGYCGSNIVSLLSKIAHSVRVIVLQQEFSRIQALIPNEVITYEDYKEVEPSYLIINTAPSVVITKALILKWKHKPLILDIASHQGGVDYEAARLNQIPAYLLPSLPPIYTPVSAGTIMANAIMKELAHE